MGGGRGRGGRRPWSTTRRRHVGKSSCRHDTDTASEEPTRCNVADMVCVVSATWRRHVGADIVLGGKNSRHDADISSQVRGCTGDFSKKKIFSNNFFSHCKLVDMVCCMKSHQGTFQKKSFSCALCVFSRVFFSFSWEMWVFGWFSWWFHCCSATC